MTAVITAIAALLVMIVGAPQASASADHSSFFSQADLVDSGWSTCRSITWSADTRGLTARQSRREITRLRQAWRLWEEASGVTATFTGREEMAYDPVMLGLRPADRATTRDHHVYIAFKTRKQVPLLAGGAVGLGKPTYVYADERRIVGGMVILMRGYAIAQARKDPAALAHVYAHEIGHVLGMGHARSRDHVMYPEVAGITELGAGDVAGIASITQPCRA